MSSGADINHFYSTPRKDSRVAFCLILIFLLLIVLIPIPAYILESSIKNGCGFNFICFSIIYTTIILSYIIYRIYTKMYMYIFDSHAKVDESISIHDVMNILNITNKSEMLKFIRNSKYNIYYINNGMTKYCSIFKFYYLSYKKILSALNSPYYFFDKNELVFLQENIDLKDQTNSSKNIYNKTNVHITNITIHNYTNSTKTYSAKNTDKSSSPTKHLSNAPSTRGEAGRNAIQTRLKEDMPKYIKIIPLVFSYIFS